jgi:hypothetical protein
MKRVSFFGLIALIGLLVVGREASAQNAFTIGWEDNPATLSGNPGSVVSGACTSTISHTGESNGAQGWSISVAADGASITSVTIQGTDGAALFNGGFEKSELADPARSQGGCAGKSGAVSAVVLSFTLPITLPQNATATIGIFGVEATIPAEGEGSATLTYVDGCRGAGQAVNNVVTQDGGSAGADLVPKTIRLVPEVDACPASLNLGFSAINIIDGQGFSPDIAGDGADGKCFANGGQITAEGTPGEVATGDIYVNIISNVPEGEAMVQGWSLSIPMDADAMTLVGATTEGTRGGLPPVGLQSGGFEKTEVVDPGRNNGQQGAVSAVVLSFTLPIVLPNGTNSVLKLTAEGVVPEAAEGAGSGTAPGQASFYFEDGLRGSGQPVNNVLTVGGGSGAAANIGTAGVTLLLVPITARPFVRGNANDDNKVNIADPIWSINALFRSGPAFPCDDAADSNDDGMVDLGDAVFTIDYLFRSGPAPSAPFPGCGLDPSGDEDGLGCEGSSSC